MSGSSLGTSTGADAETPPRTTSSALTLVVILSGILIVAMSVVGTAVALPQIATDLQTSGPGLQWAVSAYNLAFGAFTLVFGTVADQVGRKRTFVAGVTALGVGGVLSATAANIVVLDVSRAVAGLGGAAVMASGGALLAATFPGPARVKAFGAMGAAAGLGISVGPAISGVLVGTFGWRALMAAHAVVAALILIGSTVLSESRSTERRATQPLGVVLFVGGLGLLMFALIQAPESSWDSPLVLSAFVAGVLLLVGLVVSQRRIPEPLLDFSLLKRRRFAGWCLAVLATVSGFPGLLVYLPTWLQGANGNSASASGTLILMLTIPVLVLPSAAGWLVTRGLSPRFMITAALLLMAAGNAWMITVEPGVGILGLLGPLLTVGIGMGISFGITDAQAMEAAGTDRAGLTVGLVNTIRGAGEAMAIAVFGAALIIALRSRLGSPELASTVAAGTVDGPSRGFLVEQFTGSWHTVSLGVAVICAVAAVVVALLLAPDRTPASEASDRVSA